MTKDLNDANFASELASKKIAVVAFKAAWCGPCKTLSPIIDSLGEELTEDEDVTIGRLDVDANSDSAHKYGVRSIPTLIFFADGVEAKRLVGMQSKDALKTTIDSLR